MSSIDDDMILELAEYQHDPLGFVESMFPWGEKGSVLEKESIDEWQREKLSGLGEKLRSGLDAQAGKYIGEAIQEAVASGHDIGKSAFVSWLILWAISTFEGTRGVITANTDTQLKTKTWPELGKWYGLFLARHLFEYTATAICTADPNEEARKNWRIDAIPWSKATPESFAGLHNKGKRVVVIFDEASAIANVIWEIAYAAMTDAETELLWFAFGNPTRTNGRFFDCFHKDRRFWDCRQIDSRTCRIPNKQKLNVWIERYGEDSDFVRVRVRGVFPSVGENQFISSELIEERRGKILGRHQYNFAPKIITLDSAWDGGDEIVCGMRQGLASKILWVMAKNDDDVALARRLAMTEDEEKADAVFIDKGYGTGVYSYGKHLHRSWILVAFGEKPLGPTYLNKRAEMYGLLRQWLREGGILPDDPMLIEELAAQEQVPREDGKIQLVAKEDLKELDKLGRSPGRADALALTFAMPVKSREHISDPLPLRRRAEFSRPTEYDPTERK